MPRNGLVIMTALPPTLGHKYLIDFAQRYMLIEKGQLHIIVCSRDGIEPVPGYHRASALQNACQFVNPWPKWHLFDDPTAPQTPREMPGNFWGWWREKLTNIIPDIAGGIVFASDLYGLDLAKVLDCEFVPCNSYREIVNISATKIRNDPINNFQYILPEFQHRLKKTITFFGAESTGKTTFSKMMAENFNGYWVPEWAREYMEVLNLRVVDASLMDHIIKAQFSSQMNVQVMKNKPFVFQDTDLLSSIGYYKIANLELTQDAIDCFNATRSDLYILMNDGIPFTPDPLRLGGNVRESDNSFWIKLLEEYQCPYYIVKSRYKEDQEQEISEVVRNTFMDHPLYSFTRSYD